MRAPCVALSALAIAGWATGCRNDVLLGQLSDAGVLTRDAGAGPGSRIGASSRIPWNGGRYFVHGASLPWIQYSADFGGADGISTPAGRAAADAAFQDARVGGFRTVRWVMFAAEESLMPPPFTYSSSGVPNGFRPEVFRDLDIALELAATYDVYLILVAFTYDQPSADRLSEPAQRQGVADAMATLVRHAAPSDRIFAWEVSPDLGTRAELADLLRRVAPAVRETNAFLTSHVVTLDQVAATCAAGADFVGFGHLVMPVPINAFSLSYDSVDPSPDCPVIVDLIYVPAVDGANALRAVNDRGWAGALAWLLRFESASPDPLQRIDLSEAASFAAGLSETGPP